MECFKAYDVRAKVPEQLNADIAYRIGRAYAQVLDPKRVVVGYDIRQTSPELAEALSQGLLDEGVHVYDIGMCGTEEIYFATSHFEMGGGIMVTASHNPIEYNGIKFVREGSRPLSRDSGLSDIEAVAERNEFGAKKTSASKTELDARPAYIEHLLSYINVDELKPLKIVADPGNGGAGLVMKELEKHLPFEFIHINYEPDGSFPNGVPNPLLPENRSHVIEAIKTHQADLGISWDGDFDRCFLFDSQGGFIEGYYIVGLLAQACLQSEPGAKIVHDPRLTWNTIDVVNAAGGAPILSKTGHAFIKDKMREVDGAYGGEMSGHHYFREFAYCDSGMIPWLLVVQLMARSGKSLDDLIGERMKVFPCSGEINFRVESTDEAIALIEDKYLADAEVVDRIDGLCLEFPEWRFNLRASNTEPVLRLNVESRGDAALMQQKTAEISELIPSVGEAGH
ncbi:MAG: phosphomannomutase [Thiotrichales bacterium]